MCSHENNCEGFGVDVLVTLNLYDILPAGPDVPIFPG